MSVFLPTLYKVFGMTQWGFKLTTFWSWHTDHLATWWVYRFTHIKTVDKTWILYTTKHWSNAFKYEIYHTWLWYAVTKIRLQQPCASLQRGCARLLQHALGCQQLEHCKLYGCIAWATVCKQKMTLQPVQGCGRLPSLSQEAYWQHHKCCSRVHPVQVWVPDIPSPSPSLSPLPVKSKAKTESLTPSPSPKSLCKILLRNFMYAETHYVI